jgi:hypothetical protein
MSHEHLMCDFCGSDQPIWRYMMDPNLPPIVMTKVGGFKDMSNWWWACDVCSSMIETDDKMELQQRTLKAYTRVHKPKINTLPGDTVECFFRDMIEGFHELFWQRRIEGRQPLDIEGRDNG